MADFDFNLENLLDSKTLTESVKRSFYPNNEQIFKKTSYLEEPLNFNKSLISRDPARILQGEAMYRNPAFALAGYENAVRSSLHTVLAMGGDLDATVQIIDPDDPNKYLTGAQARAEIARKSFMTTGFAPGGFSKIMESFTGMKYSLGSGSSTSVIGSTSSSGQYVPEGTKGYVAYPNAPVYNMANRSISLESEMTEQEITAMKTKGFLIIMKKNCSTTETEAWTGGTGVNFNTNKLGQNLTTLGFPIHQSGSYILQPNGDYRYVAAELKAPLLGSGTRRVYPAAAITEFVDRVTDKIFIRFNFGMGRGLIAGNFDPLTASDHYVSDHAFLRAIDIFQVGNYSFDGPISPTDWLAGLNQLLDIIESFPQELHPDQIGFAISISTGLGINDEGREANDAPIRKAHPNLAKFINFAADSAHNNHIHISFGSERAGAYLPPFDPTFDPNKEFSSDKNPLYGDVGEIVYNPSVSLPKFAKTYKTDTAPFGEGSLSPLEIYILLREYGNFGEELSAIFAEMARRESSNQPWALNEHGYIGLWQLGTRTNVGGLQIVNINYPADQAERIEMWKLIYHPWKYFNITAQSADNWIRTKQLEDPTNNFGRAYVDERAFRPLNQLAMLRAKFNRPDFNDEIIYIGSKKSQSVLAPWGDGFLTHGWLAGLYYENVKTIYETCTGKSADTLDEWILWNTNADSDTRKIDPANGKSKLENWVRNRRIIRSKVF